MKRVEFDDLFVSHEFGLEDYGMSLKFFLAIANENQSGLLDRIQFYRGNGLSYIKFLFGQKNLIIIIYITKGMKEDCLH